jgi:pyruvate,orthophosphate dikinase
VVTDHEVDLVMPNIVAAASATCALSPTSHTLETLEVTVGAVVETPRACIRADRIAEAENVGFLCVDSDSLTQLVFGMARADSHSYMVSHSCCTD